jgi:hypothetical protein
MERRDAMRYFLMERTVATLPDQIVINWLPDPTTLLCIPRVRDSGAPLDVFYPGRGLSGLELDILDEFFPRISFHSFDRAARGTVSQGVKYRSRTGFLKLVGLAISYEPENLLARGLGFEHLRELMLRIGRPILRGGAGIAFGGHWRKDPENFTYELLRLISAEQEDNSISGPDSNLSIAGLYNHLAWPLYADVTPTIAAEWINCCRIIRISQELAGIDASHIITDAADPAQQIQKLLNTAITLSAMRLAVANGMSVAIPNVGVSDTVPPLSARILLGGKTQGFSGFVPGLFEEALLSLERQTPLYILGGFGGASEALANACFNSGQPPELQLPWLEATTPNLQRLRTLTTQQQLPPGVRDSSQILSELGVHLTGVGASPAAKLGTGLTDAETCELMSTHDIRRAVQLVLKGLHTSISLPLFLS